MTFSRVLLGCMILSHQSYVPLSRFDDYKMSKVNAVDKTVVKRRACVRRSISARRAPISGPKFPRKTKETTSLTKKMGGKWKSSKKSVKGNKS